MNEDNINDLIRNCRKLKFKLCGVFAANNLPQKLHKNRFLIINASLPNSPGAQWLLLCDRNNKIFFVDPFADPLDNRLLTIETYITYLLTLMHKYVNVSNINQLGVKTQNCVDFFVFILRMIFLVKEKL